MGTITDQQLQLTCLLHLTEKAIRDLLGFLVINQPLTTGNLNLTTSGDPHIALSQLLNEVPVPLLVKLQKNVNMKNVISNIFQNSPICKVRSAIEFSCFDFTNLYYLLTMNIGVFPTRKAKYRKKDGKLQCVERGKHKTKCCQQCKHNGESSCANCSASHYSCSNDHIPCCRTCNKCVSCAKPNICKNEKLRNAINFLHNTRNLNAHSTESVYNQLVTNTFVNTDFPTCNGWNTLWQKASMHLIYIYEYLNMHGVIDDTTYERRRYEVGVNIPKQSANELSRDYPEVLFQLCKRLTEQVNAALLNKTFRLQFLLVQDDNETLFSSINQFIGFETPSTLPKDQLKLDSSLSNKLELYVQTFLLRHLKYDSTQCNICLTNVKYDKLKGGSPIYKFVIEPKAFQGISELYKNHRNKESIELWEELQRCIINAVYIETSIKINVDLYFWHYGSIVIMASIQKPGTDGNIVLADDLLSRIDKSFSWNGLRITSIEKIANAGEPECITFTFTVFFPPKTIIACIESGIKEMEDRINGLENEMIKGK